MIFKRSSKNQVRNRKEDLASMSLNKYYRPTRPTASEFDLQNKKQTHDKKRFTFSKILNLLLILGIFSLILYATTLSSTPTIQLKKTDKQYYDPLTYQLEAERIINSSILNRSKLFFRSSDFESKMQEKFPEISQIASITPLGGRDLSVLINVSEPFALISSGTDKGVLNGDGVLVAKNSQFNDSELLKIRFISPQDSFEVGSRILTKDEVEIISRLQEELGDLELKDQNGLEVEEVVFDVTNGLLEVKIKNIPYFLKLSTFSDADLQIGAVKATLKQLEKENALPTKYLDVRVPNRVFVI